MNSSIIPRPVSDDEIARAHRLRSERDHTFYRLDDPDTKWVHELGEIAFNVWVNANTSLSVAWNNSIKSERQASFFVGRYTVNVKTAWRGSVPVLHDGVGVAVKDTERNVDYLFFASYNPYQKVVYLGGGVRATDYGLTRSLAYRHLIAPMDWLQVLAAENNPAAPPKPGGDMVQGLLF